ncbi:hypothetical protein PRK78_006881 [Emydomyces testavorans]|uniref:F-box domain-containing protein n=1 Tax=Emydomyces testavorans TaxID=2070801 RepID=A0AAF0IM46_9EURO|nr:hypothetical protein PRK78_006881 [Emydomyces testavorans]
MALDSSSLKPMDSSDPYPQEDSQSLSFIRLPTDIHVQLLSYLDYRDLQMLRATNTYFRHLFSDCEIAKTKRAYIRTLQEQEAKELLADEQLRFELEENEIDWVVAELELRLTCYTCFRRLFLYDFADTQTTRRRRKGHADSWKRFCTKCAIRHNKWEPGIRLPFRGQKMVYCRRCRDVKPVPFPEALEMLGLCQSCCDVIEIASFQEAFELDWYETKRLIDRFFAGYGSSRVAISDDDWLQLKTELSNLVPAV